MKCKSCAKEIEESDIHCRYCGAKLKDSSPLSPESNYPSHNQKSRKGSFTIKTAGVIFILSAVFELADPTSAVPLFGTVRSGAIAWVYHLVNVAFFLIAGLGLLEGTKRGLTAFYSLTIFYSLEQILYIADRQAIEAYFEQFNQISAIAQLVSVAEIIDAVRLVSLALLLSTWGFAAYIYYRRDYFT